MTNKLRAAMVAIVAAFTLVLTMSTTPSEASTFRETITITALPTGDRSNPSYREAVEERVKAYVSKKFGMIQFDLRSAQENGENPDVIEVGMYVNAFAESDNPSQLKSWDEFANAGSGMFTGYRYCGYGNLGGEPTNTLDRGCKLHDECYSRRGWGKCSCDFEFRSFINNNSGSMGWAEWAKAKGAAAYFATKASLGKCKK